MSAASSPCAQVERQVPQKSSSSTGPTSWPFGALASFTLASGIRSFVAFTDICTSSSSSQATVS